MLNRRNHARHNTTANIVFFQEGQPREARLVDLGDGGACIEQSDEVSVGATCKVMIQVSPFQFQTAHGQVVRSKGGQLGIRFNREFDQGWAQKIAV